MISDARGGHVSPGVYTEEKDVLYSAKSLGITNLGLAGETLKGPAFQAVPVTDWADFVDYFGGTSPEKYKGSGLPKYELPYVAKEYLKESKNLNVVRVLGLSGYENSSAFGVYATVGDKKFPLVILRSKADYNAKTEGGECEKAEQEAFNPYVTKVEVVPFKAPEYDALCVVTGETTEVPLEGVVVELSDGTKGAYADASGKVEIGKFGLNVTYTQWTGGVSAETTVNYNVSLNRSDRSYIYNVFSIDPLVGTAPLFIEAVYDYAYEYYLQNADVLSEVIVESGQTLTSGDTLSYGYVWDGKKGVLKENESGEYTDEFIINGDSYDNTAKTKYTFKERKVLVKVATPVKFEAINNGDGVKIKDDEDYTNYKETYRCAQTPWIVSEVKEATNKSINVKKLFKFYTISDGNAANYQVKVSIQRIRPDEGLFDIWIRDFYDTDASPVVLEKFINCSMVPGANNYIGYKIGTFDGGYVAKSKYVTVEIADEDGIESCVPCGFLGYPMPTYGLGAEGRIDIAYNTIFNDAIKPKRQYFGLNNEILDVDVLNYKGVTAYENGNGDADPNKITNGFHLDAILSMPYRTLTDISGETVYNPMSGVPVFVDSESGYTFTTVDPMQKAAQSVKIPRLFNEDYVDGTIYEDINLRKFTVYPYGGFDGWDIYRPERTNKDDYKASKYAIVSGCPFSVISSTELALDPTLKLGLPVNAINTDYYAYLAGYKQFANPQDVDINLFATPGVDYSNHTLLVEDALDMIEDSEDGRGGDALYIINAPKDVNEDKTPEAVVDELEDSELTSSYACTYWPWVRYYDADAKMYTVLPVTKDVVRNMAATDNNSFPWFAPAGTERGNVDCIKADIKTTLYDEDTRYEGRINPIKSFAQDGVKVWGNKTLYTQESPLNRINVRRLMLRIKKLVTEAAKHLIFEQYDATLEKQFRSLVEPILADVKSNRGIVDYRVVTESTPETRDQHILPCKILVKPTPALEYISISFVVYPEQIEFEE